MEACYIKMYIPYKCVYVSYSVIDDPMRLAAATPVLAVSLQFADSCPTVSDRSVALFSFHTHIDIHVCIYGIFLGGSAVKNPPIAEFKKNKVHLNSGKSQIAAQSVFLP